MNLVKSIKLLVVAAALSLASSAFAFTSTALTFAGNVASFENYTLIGPIDDRWTFNVASSSTGTYDTDYMLAFTAKGKVFANINNYDVSLWNASNVQVATTETPDGLFGSALISAGSYYLKVAGTGVGQAGGNYWGTLTVSPVPEPGEWALMLSGLGLIGFMVRRRTADVA
jgi:hypothetical protein